MSGADSAAGIVSCAKMNASFSFRPSVYICSLLGPYFSTVPKAFCSTIEQI